MQSIAVLIGCKSKPSKAKEKGVGKNTEIVSTQGKQRR